MPVNSLHDVRWIDFPSKTDSRGILTSIEAGIDTPFEVKRVFYCHHITTDRGGHAHRDTDQVLISVAGRLKMDLSDGINTKTFELDDPCRGIYLPRMLYISLYDFSLDAVGLVLASTHYDISRSIRSWDDYLKAIKVHDGA
tara:strand:- start:1194 stop:1616 length:423 start_codon:yes stop_codon:yes gene_type:complete